MAELPSDEDNELNFSDYDANSDSDDDDNTPRPPTTSVIAHKEMKTVQISDAEEDSEKEDDSDREESDKEESTQELEFETISPPAEQSDEEENNKNDNEPKMSSTVLGVYSNQEPEQQAFEPISPVSDHENNFETISPPGSPMNTSQSTSDKQPQFENISEDEDEEEIKKPEELPEGKFSPVQESDNELNFNDESSNDSGYHIIQNITKPPVEETVKIGEKSSYEESELPDDIDDDDIEAPMPSPFSDIGDLDDITESDGQIISDILKDTDATEQQFEFKNEIYNEDDLPPDKELGSGDEDGEIKSDVEDLEVESGPSKEKEGIHDDDDDDDDNDAAEISKAADKNDNREKDNEEHILDFLKENEQTEEDEKEEDAKEDAKDDEEKDDGEKDDEEKDDEEKDKETEVLEEEGTEKEVLQKEDLEKDLEEDVEKEDIQIEDSEKEVTEKKDNEEKGDEEKGDAVGEEGEEGKEEEAEEKDGGIEKKKDEDKKDEDKKDEEEEEGEDAGDLIADIFGESDEEEEFEGFADEEMPEGEDDRAASDDEIEPVRAVPAPEEDKKGESSDDEPRMPARDFVNDFDVMLEQKRAEKRIRRTRKDVDIISDNDEIIASMIRHMKEAAEEDRMLNQSGKAATKKLKMLGSVITHLRKSDLQGTFIDCGVLSGIKEWLTPLPDHALPHIHIRKLFLQVLLEFPPLDKSALKSSGIGRAVMLLFKHPKETRDNKQMAGRIIGNWARPIFNVSTNFLDMSKEEREERDKKTLMQNKRKEESEVSLEPKRTKLDKEEEDMENQPRKPGDKGWCQRARVPQSSNRDYVNRPISKLDAYEQTRALNTKMPKNRYEKHAMKMKVKKGSKAKAMDISLSGSKMNL